MALSGMGLGEDEEGIRLGGMLLVEGLLSGISSGSHCGHGTRYGHCVGV